MCNCSGNKNTVRYSQECVKINALNHCIKINASNQCIIIKPMLTSRAMSISLRKRFVEVYAWSTFMYECEAWTINREMERKIEAAEMWFFRRMLKIPWTERVSNEQVLHRARTNPEMMKMVRPVALDPDSIAGVWRQDILNNKSKKQIKIHNTHFIFQLLRVRWITTSKEVVGFRTSNKV